MRLIGKQHDRMAERTLGAEQSAGNAVSDSFRIRHSVRIVQRTHDRQLRTRELYEHRLERTVERKPQALSAMLPPTTYPLLTQPVPTTLGLAATEMRKNRWGIHVLPLRARLASRKAGGCARSR